MSNPWDKDPIVAPASTHDSAPWLKDPQQASTAVDMAESAGSGVVRGIANAPFGPASLAKMGADAIVGGGEKLVRWATGMGPPSAETLAARDAAQKEIDAGPIPSPERAAAAVNGALDNVLHKPQTTAGKYAETIGEFAPTAVAGPGGIVRKTAETVVPAVASEAAGEATGDNPWARIVAGLAGNTATAAGAMHASAPERMVARSARGVSDVQFAAAQDLQDQAARIGVPLSGPEALQHVTNGATKLADVLRVVEGSSRGGNATDRFFAQRPGQVADATGRTLDQIAPASAAPSTLGPRAATAAGGALDDVRRGINNATAPAYAAAQAHEIDPADFAPIADDPAFQASLARLRADPVLGPTYQHLPDNTIGVVDAVTKDMRDRGVALGNAANPGFSSQTAGMYGAGAAEARDIARDPSRGGSQAYDDALTAQEQARRQNLNPLEQGPLGRVAAANDTRGATGAMFPDKPLAGGHTELADAATRLENQDPGVVPALARQHIADAADTALQRNVGGPNQFGGAKLAKAVAGTGQKAQNLQAVLAAAGSQSDLPTLLRVLQATGMRKAQGSATEFNRQTAADMARPSAMAELGHAISTGGLSVPVGMKDAMARAWLGKNSSSLADLFLAPDSTSRIQEIVAHGQQSPLAQMFARQVFQLPAEARAR